MSERLTAVRVFEAVTGRCPNVVLDDRAFDLLVSMGAEVKTALELRTGRLSATDRAALVVDGVVFASTRWFRDPLPEEVAKFAAELQAGARS